MDFDLSDDQRAFQETARQFAQDEWLPHAPGWDEREEFPEEALRKAAALGFAGIYVGEKFGGSGLPRLDAALIFEELATACVSTAAYLSIHNMAAWMIDRFGDEEQRAPLSAQADVDGAFRQLLPDRAGQRLGRRGAADHARRRDGDHYVLNGTKAFISGGGRSDIYVAMVRTGGPGPRGISCLVVENGTPGLSFGKQEKKLGWNSQPTAAVIFEDCRVPVANRLGAEGDGFQDRDDGARRRADQYRRLLDRAARGPACEAARGYMVERRSSASASPISRQCSSSSPTWRPSSTRRALMLRRAAAQPRCRRSRRRRCTARWRKRFATDAGFRIVNEALQLHGGYGYLKDFPIERYLRDVRVHQILEGTNEIMRVIIARRLLRQ